MVRTVLAAAVALLTLAPPAHATSGPGCFRVVNVAAGDALNMRSGPSARNAITDRLVPGRHGIVSQSGPCVPPNASLSSRWCPVAHYNGDRTTSGWVKRRFVAPSDCP